MLEEDILAMKVMLSSLKRLMMYDKESFKASVAMPCFLKASLAIIMFTSTSSSSKKNKSMSPTIWEEFLSFMSFLKRFVELSSSFWLFVSSSKVFGSVHVRSISSGSFIQLCTKGTCSGR